MVTNDVGFDVLDNDQCSGRNRNSERLLRLHLLGDGICGSWLPKPLFSLPPKPWAVKNLGVLVAETLVFFASQALGGKES